ncbi:MAG: tetratricopeptide repeat protein [Clostridia bacterium]|nr:tetratricopeptide repeat protein [Clostridia bacterium]
MIKKIAVCLGMVILITLAAYTGIYAEGLKPDEMEVISKSDESFSKKDFSSAANMLAQFLDNNPDTKNESIYYKLGDLYDNYIFDFEKAIEVYKKYLTLFPSGRFRDIFSANLSYLEKNRKDWSVLKEYRHIVFTSEARASSENIEMMEELLVKHTASSIRPDMHNWLAKEYFQNGRYGRSLNNIEKFIETFPDNGKPDAEKSLAYMLYSDASIKNHRYSEAQNALDKVMQMGNPNSYLDYDEKVRYIIKEKSLWMAYIISGVFVFLLAVLIFIFRPWREKNFDLSLSNCWKQLFLMTAVTIGSMVYVNYLNHGLLPVFPAILVAAIAVLVIIRMLSYVAYKIKKPVYFAVSFLLMISGTYISLYVTDSVSIVWNLVQSLKG